MPRDPADLLREHGLQVTAQRLAVLRAVARRPHCRADKVVEDVCAEIGTISRQAVYDALGILTENGLIRQLQPAGSPALYENRVGDKHHHVICRECGKTVDVDCTLGEAHCMTAAADSGFQIDEAEVIYRGVCPKCLPKEPRERETRQRTKQDFDTRPNNLQPHPEEESNGRYSNCKKVPCCEPSFSTTQEGATQWNDFSLACCLGPWFLDWDLWRYGVGPRYPFKSVHRERQMPVTGATAVPSKYTETVAMSNQDWWPNQLNLDILHQNSLKGNPLGGDFN